MKVLIINGSPRPKGNTTKLLNETKDVFASLGVEVDAYSIAGKRISGCMACRYCHTHEGCAYHDEIDDLSKRFKEADGLVVASPVYYASPNGTLISLLDRLFQSSRFEKRYKVGAAFAIARRGGTTASFDVLNKYFTISGMPVASGDYWNNGFGGGAGEIALDAEGLRNARVVAKRMVFLMTAIAEAKKAHPELLQEEPKVATNFIRPKGE
ncbi:MAG: flavodoxin family protein [Bacilli bacterium]|nr:flavodoxin family protein [Bacilli bacterium]